MPVVRINRSGGEGEGEGLRELRGVAAAGEASSDVVRVSNNLQLAQYIGQFVAGEVASQFQAENLADLLKGKNQIMISGSGG
jgi:hypothetical protein